jgi:chemotaxis protein MotB
MPASMRTSLFCFVGLFVCGQTACNMVPYQHYQASQLQAFDLHQQNQALAAQQEQSQYTAQKLAAENQGLRSSLDTANQRVDNLKSGLSSAQERYISLLNNARNQKSPLSDSTTRRFQDLADKYPEFEFDPHTGVSKFHSDILFSSGSAQINRNAAPLLQDFADIMNAEDARRLNILVVGHTDDERIIKRSTANLHPTNWHLSTNRANSVLLALSKSGINEARMGAAGYSMFQPVTPNTGDKTRAMNRRVEIYVLAPDAVVAGWDPATSRN